MTGFLLLVILIMSALSLVSYMYCWNDIKTGKPHIISLRQITNIMDRDELDRLFGRHSPRYHYKLPPAQKRAFIKRYGWFFYLECAADTLCLLGAWHFLITDEVPRNVVTSFIILAGICQGINFVYSTILVRRWAHQIKEEIENSDK